MFRINRNYQIYAKYIDLQLNMLGKISLKYELRFSLDTIVAA